MHTMHTIYYLCLIWHGRITPATYAATLREYAVYVREGITPTI